MLDGLLSYEDLDEMDRQVQRKDKTISSSHLVGEYPIPGMCTCKA